MKNYNKIFKEIYDTLNQIDDLRHKHDNQLNDLIMKIDKLIEQNVDRDVFDQWGEDILNEKISKNIR